MSEKNTKRADRKKRKFTGNEYRMFFCPQCDKPRMKKDLDFDIKEARTKVELTSPSTGEPILLFKDVCEPCHVKNFTKYFMNTPVAPKAILDSLDGKGELDQNKSLEEML
jgi:hypothetical protein